MCWLMCINIYCAGKEEITFLCDLLSFFSGAKGNKNHFFRREKKGKFTFTCLSSSYGENFFAEKFAKKHCKRPHCSVFFEPFLREIENLPLAFFPQKQKICCCFFSLPALYKYLWTTLEQYRSSDVVIVHQISEFVFNVSPSVKAIWRLGHGMMGESSEFEKS